MGFQSLMGAIICRRGGTGVWERMGYRGHTVGRDSSGDNSIWGVTIQAAGEKDMCIGAGQQRLFTTRRLNYSSMILMMRASLLSERKLKIESEQLE